MSGRMFWEILQHFNAAMAVGLTLTLVIALAKNDGLAIAWALAGLLGSVIGFVIARDMRKTSS